MDNQRITLSKRLLKEALLSFLKEKQLIDISIKELCDRSGVNRSTFYRHYDNLSDLLSEIIEEIFGMLTRTNEISFQDPDNAQNYIAEAILFFRDHHEYDPLFFGNSSAMELLSKRMEDDISGFLSGKDPRSQYLVRYILAGSYAIIRDWITGGRKEDAKALSDIIYSLSLNTAQSF
ncbi:MAG: TetR/AcrR family transcriptional regulator [Erysipelotrichaceae bacterium]|nr:TetR/AcrR family transcriptional regulator [Erysipelotrichaceae bacterium]